MYNNNFLFVNKIVFVLFFFFLKIIRIRNGKVKFRKCKDREKCKSQKIKGQKMYGLDRYGKIWKWL